MINTIFQSVSAWPIRGEYDVVVVGAGPGGIGAAVAAARLGARTLIVERYGFPGGVATTACCPYLMGFAAGGRQIVGGVADELVRELDRMGEARFTTSPGSKPETIPIGDRPLEQNVITSIEGVRVAANRLLEKNGVARLYYTALIGAEVRDQRVVAIAIDNADGPGLLRAKTFVDTTGDANLVWRAGGEVREAPVEDSMTKTILMRMGGVVNFHREPVSERFERLFKEGKAPFPNQDRFMGQALLHPREVLLNLPLVCGNALSAGDLTAMDIELREQVFKGAAWYRRYFPEFAEAYLIDAGVGVGVRAGRSIVGLETITCADLDNGTPVSEPVALGGRSYGGHGLHGFSESWAKGNPGLRGIPFKTLMSASLENVVAGGRAISAEPRVISSFRLMSRCLAIGQAAGTLAAMAANAGAEVRNVAYDPVRRQLLAQGAILQ